MKRFAMDRIGAGVTRHVRAVIVSCIAVTLAALAALSTGLEFNGSVTDILKADTPVYNALESVERAFHPFSTDEVLVVEATDFGAPETYAALEDFVSDLQLVDGVAATISLFALPGPGSGIEPWLGTEAAKELPPAARLDRFLEIQPLARDLTAADRTMTLIVLMIAQEDAATVLSPASRAEIESIADSYGAVLTVSFAGLGEIHRSIERALRSDTRLLATVSISLCVVLALLIFRSWRAAVIAALPPIAGVLWFFGFAALAGVTIDTITTIIPTLLIVVGFADAVHLYYAILRARGRGLEGAAAIRDAIAETGPACFLTSLTTAIACLGIGLAGSATLNTFAWSGFAGMFIELAAVLALVPALALVLEPRDAGAAPRTAIGFSAIGRAAVALLPWRTPLFAASLVLFALLAYAQSQLETGFRLSEHLRASSPLAQLERRLKEKGLGSGQVFVVVDDADGKPGFNPPDAARLAAAGRAVFPDASVETAGSLFPDAAQIQRLAEEDQPLLRRYVAKDGSRYLLPVPVDLSLTSNQIAAYADDLNTRLAAAGLSDVSEIVGLPLLSAYEVPRMISDLQLGFYAALVLVVLVLVYATGSLRMGLLSLIPNLIPILGVEAWLYLTTGQLSMTAAVAFTIAFGIAVDDSIHVINRYQRAHIAGETEPLVLAIRDTVSPISASTLLLVAGLGVTQVSSLPSVAVFGQLVSAALVLALFSSLFLLPAFVRLFANGEKR